MFKVLIWFMKAVLELAALLVILLGVSQGAQVATLFGFGNSGEIVHIVFGLLAGTSAAAILFGMPIVIININENVARTADLLVKLEKNSRPAGFAMPPSFPKDEPLQTAARAA